MERFIFFKSSVRIINFQFIIDVGKERDLFTWKINEIHCHNSSWKGKEKKKEHIELDEKRPQKEDEEYWKRKIKKLNDSGLTALKWFLNDPSWWQNCISIMTLMEDLFWYLYFLIFFRLNYSLNFKEGQEVRCDAVAKFNLKYPIIYRTE